MNKKYIVLSIIIVLALGGIGAIYVKQHKNKNISQNGKILADKQRNLSPEEEKIYKDKIIQGQDYIKALKITDPKYKTLATNTYVFLAQQYFGLGQMEMSKEMYLKALALQKNSEQALVGLSVTLSDAGEKQESLKYLEQALNNNQSNPRLWLQYIEVKETDGAPVKDIEDLYQKALDKTARYTDVLTSDAAFQEKNGNIAAAISLLQEAKKQYPNDSTYDSEIKRLQAIKK